MRGSPFGQSDFAGGLNTVASPYKVLQGESRDCLNVVGAIRGAVRKRYGSTTFASSANAPFPTNATTDSFERANENPLNNAGKWTTLPGTTLKGKIQSNRWEVTVSSENQGAYWNAAEQTNPAVAIKLTKLSSGFAFLRLAILASVSEFAGYYVQYQPSAGTCALSRVTGGVTTSLASTSGLFLSTGTKLGIAARNGVVSVWYEEVGLGWKILLEAADSTYTKGYGAFLADSRESNPWYLNNFSIGEMPAGTSVTKEFTSLLPCQIGGTNYLIGSAGTKLYSVTESGEISEIKSGLTEGKRWSIIQSTAGSPNKKTGGPVYLSNGVDKPLYWSGATKTTEAKTWVGEEGAAYYEDATSKEHVPNGKYMVLAGNRIWTAGMSDDTSAVRFSDFSALSEGGKQTDPTAWPKENVIRFDRSDNQPITGLGVVGPYVLVFKQRKTFVIYDLGEGANRKISDSIGCVAHRSIAETPQGTFFLTPDQGVYVTNGTTVKEMSFNVRPTFQGTDSTESRAAKVGSLETAAAGSLNNHYYVSYMAKDGSYKTLDYDLQLSGWWLHDVACNQWVAWSLSEGPQFYGCRAKENEGIIKVFVPNVYQDVGSNYVGARGFSAYWISSWEPFYQFILRHKITAPNQKKRVRQFFLDGSGQVIPFVFRSFKTSVSELSGVVNEKDMATLEQPVQLTQEEREVSACRFYSLGVGRVWSFGFGNKSAEPFEVDGIQYLLQFRKS